MSFGIVGGKFILTSYDIGNTHFTDIKLFKSGAMPIIYFDKVNVRRGIKGAFFDFILIL